MKDTTLIIGIGKKKPGMPGGPPPPPPGMKGMGMDEEPEMSPDDEADDTDTPQSAHDCLLAIGDLISKYKEACENESPEEDAAESPDDEMAESKGY